MVFITTLFIGVISFNSVLPLAAGERPSYYHERASQTYSPFWYLVGSTVAEIPFVFASTFVYTVIFYPFVGFRGNFSDMAYYSFQLSLVVLMNVYFGQFVVFATPRLDVAVSIGALVNSTFMLFMGFNPPQSQIPSGYRWLSTIVPPKYSLSILLSEIFAKCENGSGLGCAQMANVPPVVLAELHKSSVTVQEFAEFMFHTKNGDNFKNTMIILAVILLYRALALLAFRFMNYQKK
ncbi:unnamed protein product [Aphanomyces euteiches]